MSTVLTTEDLIQAPGGFALTLRYLRRNRSSPSDCSSSCLTAFTVMGMLTIDVSHAYPLAVKPKQPPGGKYLLGTDFFGRDLLSEMVVGMWQTALIGVLAGALGTLIGVFLGFVSAYFGGFVDMIIKGTCQILTPIPCS